MSDTVIIAAISSLTTIASIVISSLLNRADRRRQNKVIETKVDNYHKEVNGNMEKLITTTKELGEKVGAEKNQAETDAKDQKDK